MHSKSMKLAAAKIRDDAMSEVIGANKRKPPRNLAKSSAGAGRKIEIVEKTG